MCVHARAVSLSSEKAWRLKQLQILHRTSSDSVKIKVITSLGNLFPILQAPTASQRPESQPPLFPQVPGALSPLHAADTNPNHITSLSADSVPRQYNIFSKHVPTCFTSFSLAASSIRPLAWNYEFFLAFI